MPLPSWGASDGSTTGEAMRFPYPIGNVHCDMTCRLAHGTLLHATVDGHCAQGSLLVLEERWAAGEPGLPANSRSAPLRYGEHHPLHQDPGGSLPDVGRARIQPHSQRWAKLHGCRARGRCATVPLSARGTTRGLTTNVVPGTRRWGKPWAACLATRSTIPLRL